MQAFCFDCTPDLELADVLIQRVALEPHGAEEGDGGELVVEHILPVDDPHTCHTVIWSHSYLVTQLYGHTVIWSQTHRHSCMVVEHLLPIDDPYFHTSTIVTQSPSYGVIEHFLPFEIPYSIFLYGMWQCSMVTQNL